MPFGYPCAIAAYGASNISWRLGSPIDSPGGFCLNKPFKNHETLTKFAKREKLVEDSDENKLRVAREVEGCYPLTLLIIYHRRLPSEPEAL